MKQSTENTCRYIQKKLDDVRKDFLGKVGGQVTAREMMQCYIGAEGKQNLPAPGKCEAEAGEEIEQQE